MNNPTAKQKRTFSKLVALGCIACLQDGKNSPAEIHHYRKYGYRNHDKVMPLCPAHHRYQNAVMGIPNREKNPVEFTERYGTDKELVDKCFEMIGE